MRRLTIPALILWAVAAPAGAVGAVTPAPADSDGVCAAFSVPEPLGLSCRPNVSAHDPSATIGPQEGPFALLSRMSVRRLSRSADALAWKDPAAWLEEQMTLDTSAFAGALQALASDPDSPLAGNAMRSAVDTLGSSIERLGRLALQTCEDPEETAPGRWDMSCDLAPGGLGMHLHLRLVEAGDERWSIGMRAMNEQRLRHFEAIANSFKPQS
jgi:hypothetical protein